MRLVIKTAVSIKYVVLEKNFNRGFRTDLDLNVKHRQRRKQAKPTIIEKGSALSVRHEFRGRMGLDCVQLIARSPTWDL